MITLINDDAVKWANEYSGPLFHAFLSDPPYHLTTITKRFGPENSAPAIHYRDGAFGRVSKGFMGNAWDGGDLAFQPSTWESFKKVLYPGAFGMAFAASRNWARMAAAIEGLVSLNPGALINQADVLAHARDTKDWSLVESVENWLRDQASFYDAIRGAGLIIHPTIFLWAYSSGFPKATNPSKLLQHSRGVVDSWMGKSISNEAMENIPLSERARILKTEKSLKDHRYGLQALKPAVEPIIVFQKPYEGRPLDNITGTGAGALNVEAGRIPDAPWTFGTQADIRGGGYNSNKPSKGDVFRRNVESDPAGRWPSNFILGDPSAAEALDMQSGERPVSGSAKSGKPATGIYPVGMFGIGDKQGPLYNDSGGASRFFYNVSQDLDSSDPVFYVPKASTAERDAGLEDGVVLPNAGKRTLSGGKDTRGRSEKHVKNIHPTVKPLDLNRYLASLLLPPREYSPRRIVVPFSGVGSECIGAHLAGWDEVTGIESDTKNGYIEIAKKRIDYWTRKSVPQIDLFSGKTV